MDEVKELITALDTLLENYCPEIRAMLVTEKELEPVWKALNAIKFREEIRRPSPNQLRMMH